jgi:hypothetical protein
MKALCVFDYKYRSRSVLGESLADFRDGFWVDSTCTRLALFEERAYWIPPARILHVEHVK